MFFSLRWFLLKNMDCSNSFSSKIIIKIAFKLKFFYFLFILYFIIIHGTLVIILHIGTANLIVV
jgi:hypothetical protein